MIATETRCGLGLHRKASGGKQAEDVMEPIKCLFAHVFCFGFGCAKYKN